MITLILAVVTAVAVSFLCSLLETVLYSLSWSTIERLRKSGSKAGELLYTLRTQVDKPIAAILTLNTIANTAGATVAGAAFLSVYGSSYMMALTTVSAFFATYLVRSGVIQSVHAFGDGSVGTPLTVFVLGGLLIALWIPFVAPKTGKPLAGLDSREGFLTLVAWVLLALAGIILVATMWPVISTLWSDQPRGLDARFYNRVCLPLGALLVLMMAACPWLGWGGGLRNKTGFFVVMGGVVVSAAVIWALGFRQPTALLGAAAAVGIVLGAALLLADKANRSQAGTLAALGAHVGMALVAIGIAFSGPYTIDNEMVLARGASGKVGAYTATLLSLDEGRRVDHDYIAARLQIFKDGKPLGIVAPERRLYDKFGNMIPSAALNICRPDSRIPRPVRTSRRPYSRSWKRIRPLP